ncbi:glycosyltransferase family 4 protein [Desulfovibrio ferrophilus]|uniref:Glycosyl transferase group 1 n=1 Tax=Desulfovibrio ferrophilus TaxID=241368 RepID=A0A2Z6AXB2_9BACT|nr:glycosyltransferase family 4 protein [Desulfovibrio ferrophilus]BBD07848.1 glycosyl transferase group 1 [Desulfovibrio ferrophilus]
MRIIYMTSSSSLSGGTRQAMYSARGLMDRGHNVTFLVPHNAEITGLDDRIDWRRLPEAPADWRAEAERALPEKGEPCIVHAFHNKANKKLAWWGLNWRKRGCVCLGYRGVIYRPSNPLPYWSPGIDCFVANSQACAKVLRQTGLSSKRLEVIYNGIPDSRITPLKDRHTMRSELGLKKGIPVLGTVAGDKSVKGVEFLLRGFAEAMHSGVKAQLLLVGARAERWAPLAEELGIADKALFRGRVENVADHLQVMDAFFLPSLKESLPNVVLEAFFFGLPIVASNVGGLPELVHDNGLLIPPKDSGAIAAAMTKVCHDPDLRKVWGRASQSKSVEFTMTAKVQRTADVYNMLLERRGISTEI